MVECVSEAVATDYSTQAPLGRMAVNWHWTVNHGRPAFHYWNELTSAAKRLQPWPARTQRKFVSLRDDLKMGPFPCTYWLIHTLSMQLTMQNGTDMKTLCSLYIYFCSYVNMKVHTCTSPALYLPKSNLLTSDFTCTCKMLPRYYLQY